MIFETLNPPVMVELPFGQVEAKVRAWGKTEQPWNEPPINSYCVLGNFDTNGKFQAIPDTEDYYQFTKTDWETLRKPNAQGKKQDQYRNDDVVKLHKTKKGLA